MFMVFIPFYCHNLYSRPHVLTNREKAKREKLPTCNPVQSKVGFTDCWHLWLYRSPTYLLHWPPSLAGLQSTVVKLGGHLVLIWPPHYTVTARLTYSQTITRASPSGPCTHSGEDWEGEETDCAEWQSYITSDWCPPLYQPVQSGISRLCHRWVQRSPDSSSSCSRHIISVFRNTPAADRSPPVQKPARPEVSLFR